METNAVKNTNGRKGENEEPRKRKEGSSAGL